MGFGTPQWSRSGLVVGQLGHSKTAPVIDYPDLPRHSQLSCTFSCAQANAGQGPPDLRLRLRRRCCQEGEGGNTESDFGDAPEGAYRVAK
eukprot:2613091-Alexandrium_andersonii.AAC.1